MEISNRHPARWIITALLILFPSAALHADPTTQPAGLARVDALLADASRKLDASQNPEEDCRAAAELLTVLVERHTIDDATARQYTSQIAYLRAAARETIIAVAFQKADTDLAAFQSKLADDKLRLLDPKIDPAEARRIAAELAAASHQAAADLRALPSDDRRTTELAERMSGLQQQLEIIAARHSVHQTVESLRQQWRQMSAQSSGWQDETPMPWVEAQRLPDPLVSLERTRALIVSCGSILSSAGVERARAQAGDDAELEAFLAEVRSDQQAAITKASAATADLLDQADRVAHPDPRASATAAAAMVSISRSLRTSLAVLPGAEALADRAEISAKNLRAAAGAIAAAVPTPAPSRPAPVAATPSPAPARTIVAPPHIPRPPALDGPRIKAGPADLSLSIPAHRDGIESRLAWTLTGALAALLAFCKSRVETEDAPNALPDVAGAIHSARLYTFARVQLDSVGLLVVLLGSWWLLSSPNAALVPAVAMIVCGLLGAIDLIGNRLSLSHGLIEIAHCVAGPTSVAAMFIFIVHLFIGGAGFI